MALRWDDDARTLELGVRDLLATEDRRAPLNAALSERARMRAGSELHREVQARYDDDVATEVTLRRSFVVREWTCTVHGRADAMTEEDGRTVVEEIKSSLLGADALMLAAGFPAWERQLAIYVRFAAAARRPDPVGRLRVVSLADGAERLWSVLDDPAIDAWIGAKLDALVRAREERLAWVARRRASPVRFAHDTPRPAQEPLVEAAEVAAAGGRHLLLSAPTGLGKTAAILHGVLRATAATGHRTWWATARTTQQQVVERTARAIAERGSPLRTVTLRAREKACRRGGEPCDPGTCPLRAPPPERVDAALAALADLGQPDADALGAVAAAHALCPHDLALDWIERCDLVIGDYNYAFDPDVRMERALAAAPHVLVVDEAHQLPDRAMDWGSPALDTALVGAALAALPNTPAWRPFRALAREVAEALADAALLSVGEGDGTAIVVEPNVRRWAALRDAVDDLGLAFAALQQPAAPGAVAPSDLFGPADPGAAWIDLARAVHRFGAALQRAGEETVGLWSSAPALFPGTPDELPGGRLALSCRDPSRVLGPSFEAAHATVSMSATLAPAWFYRDRCGIHPDRADELAAPCPFPPEHRRVLVVGGVSTALAHRLRDRDRVASVVSRCVLAVPGNAAVFFGSFEHLREVREALDLGDRELLVQSPAMDEAERARVVDRMRDRTAPGPRVLLGVLGGLFSEGIDLPGDALRAVIVVGPALPPPTLERKLLQAWYDDRFGDGFTLAYVLPGMTRVAQAGGRVVRTPEDRGAVVLVCRRFLRTAYAEWLPTAWEVEKAKRPWEDLEEFFGRD